MSTKIKHPEPFTGSAIGLDFVDSFAEVAELSEEIRPILAAHGFTFEDIEDAVTIPDGVPDETWTVKQIDAWAVREEVAISEAKNKPEKLELIAAVTAARTGSSDDE